MKALAVALPPDVEVAPSRVIVWHKVHGLLAGAGWAFFQNFERFVLMSELLFWSMPQPSSLRLRECAKGESCAK